MNEKWIWHQNTDRKNQLPNLSLSFSHLVYLQRLRISFSLRSAPLDTASGPSTPWPQETQWTSSKSTWKTQTLSQVNRITKVLNEFSFHGTLGPIGLFRGYEMSKTSSRLTVNWPLTLRIWRDSVKLYHVSNSD